MGRWRHHSEERSSSSISVLWLQYSSLGSARDELHRKARTVAMSELEKMVFEHEELEPILLELNSKAMQIASANWQSAERNPDQSKGVNGLY